MSEYGDDNDVKLDLLQKEVDKIRMKREVKEQLSDRILKINFNLEEIILWSIAISMGSLTTWYFILFIVYLFSFIPI